MRDENKAKDQLIAELRELRRRNAALEDLVQARNPAVGDQAFEVLKESEEKYYRLYNMMRLITDNVPDLIWAKDLEGRFLFVNKAMCSKLLKCENPEEPIGKTDLYFAEKERNAGHKHTFGAICTDSDAITKERKAPGRFLEDGLVRDKYLVLDVHKAPLLNEEGEMMGTTGCGRDVTKERETEEALRRSEARYRGIVQDQTELISRFLPDKRLVFVNDAYCRFFGETAKEVLGRKFWHHVPEDDRQKLRSFLRSLSPRNPVATIEHRVVSSTGEIRWLQWTDRAIFDERGKPAEFQAVGRDITQRKRAEESLHESEKLFREVLENVKLLAVILDSQGKIAFCNDFLLDFTGWKRDDLIGQNWFDKLMPPDVRQELLPLFLQKFPTGEFPSYYENEILTRFGERRTIAWNNSFSRDGQGNVTGGTSLGQDVTDRKRLEDQLCQTHKMEAVGTLAGGIAHDFNNILAIIIGYTEIIMADAPDFSPIRHDLEQVLQAAHRAKDLVKQILIFSRMGSEKASQTVRLSTVVREALQWIRATLPTTVELRHDIAALPGTALADPAEIHQVLVNLCTNACHAMGDEGGVLEVSLRRERFESQTSFDHWDLKPGAYFKLTVKDNGRGMDRFTLKRIFDPYFTTKGPGEGSGLGLAVVNGIVKRLGGGIAVSSQQGAGTTFVIYIPQIESELHEGTSDKDPAPHGNGRILFVDDEEAIVDMNRRLLERIGFEVQTAANGGEALEVFSRQPEAFDLVITDYAMPHMRGIDLARELLRIRPDIPVILCSGFSDEFTEEEARKTGIRKFVMKPLNMREIAELIRETLNRKA